MSAEEKYKDIIDKSWDDNPEFFRKHPRMTLEDRAKIFAPFAALRGHSSRLQEEVSKLKRTSRPELSEEELEILSDKMMQVQKGMHVSITCFMPDNAEENLGYYIEVSGEVDALDPVRRVLRIRTREADATDSKEKNIQTISFHNLLDINQVAAHE